jgi:signal transduction histidine kinase
MGLFIAAMLAKRYGGAIRVGDRVPGRSEEGAAFCFTLKKVVP